MSICVAMIAFSAMDFMAILSLEGLCRYQNKYQQSKKSKGTDNETFTVATVYWDITIDHRYFSTSVFISGVYP